jgi:hypothetical protein
VGPENGNERGLNGQTQASWRGNIKLRLHSENLSCGEPTSTLAVRFLPFTIIVPIVVIRVI